LEGTNATMFAPSGASTNGPLGQAVLTAFNQGTAVYLGVIPNEITNIGQSVVFSGVSVTGVDTPLVDNFATSSNWVATVAQDASGVAVNPVGAIAKLKWPATPSGFTLTATNPLVKAAVWPTATASVRTVGTNRVTVLGPDVANRFFRLEKP
jgi:hypothetical protein